MSNSISASTLEKFTTFGDLLRFLRRRAGITQMELAIAVGYSDAQISRLEQNLRLPDIPTIEARFVSALDLEDEPKAVTRLLDLAANVRREDAPGLGLCPYKGLSFFDEIDSDLFAGREALTAKLAARVLALTSHGETTQERFLAIIGASGSGKSSLARAGLVPTLRWNKLSTNWLMHIITPTAHPLESLAASLTDDTDSAIATTTLMDDLSHESRSLNLHIKRALKSMGASHFLLVIDQFEELFTLCRSEEERAAFIENLLNAASDVDGPAIIIITLRADFYTHCANYPRFREALARNQEYIGAMSQEELRRAIEEPARRGRWEFEPGLVDMLLHDVGSEPGALPLLSHALLETWQRRQGRTMTLSGYTSSGGVRGAISETAEAVFADQFSHTQQAIARRIFLRLTELGGETATGDTRRRVTFDELILKPDEAAETNTVLQALAAARLIIISEDTVEVAHEALIREWPTLHGWLEEDRECLRLHRHLTEAAQEWLAAKQEPDTLFRGARLAQTLEWASANDSELNPLERDFLAASIDLSECEVAERETQRQRELEAAQKLAESEKERADLECQRAEEQARAAKELRMRAYYLASAFIIALGMAFTALFFGAQARRAAISAQDQQRISFSRELAAAAVSNLELDPERSILLAMHAVSVTYSVDKTWPAEAEDALRRALLASRLVRTLSGHTNRVMSVAFSPDGSSLATASDDGTARIWNAATGQELINLHTNATRGRHGVGFSPDGTRLVTASDSGTAKVWDLRTGQELLTLRGHSDWISAVAYSPDGKQLATASEDRTAIVWDAVTGQLLVTLRGHSDEVTDVAFSPDGTRLATSSLDEKVKVWDPSTGREELTISGHSAPVNGVAFSPDGKRLATTSSDNTAIVWDAMTGRNLLSLRGHTDALWDVAFSPDGKRLATTSFDGKVILWDTTTGQGLLTLSGHEDLVTGVAFSPDCVQGPNALPEQCGTSLATSSLDGTAKVWNVSFSQELFTFYIPTISAGALSPDGGRLAAGLSDGNIKVWDFSSALEGDVMTGSLQLDFPGHEETVNSLAFSPDGKRLATASEDYLAKVWDTATGSELLTLAGHSAGVVQIVYSPDGKHLATSGKDMTVKVWDAESGKPLLTLSTPVWSYAIAYSPDGTRLAAALNDGTAKVWDAATGVEQLTLRGHGSEVWSIAFSPDGKRLATASNDRTAIVWDATTGQEIFTLRGHRSAINDIAFSPDGTRLATASQDGLVKLWNASTGQETLNLYGQSDPVAGLAFSQDGKRLLTASTDGLVRFYLLPIEDLVTLARSRVTRTLKTEECEQYLHLPQGQCPEDSTPTSQVPAETLTPPTELAPSTNADNKVCQMTDESGVNDQFYNQITFEGVQHAAEIYGWGVDLFEPRQQADYQKNIVQLLQSNCDLIVAPTGVNFSDGLATAAKANPAIKFQITEWAVDPTLENVWEQNYAIDQAGFLAGYLAAGTSKTGKVATYGGVAYPNVTTFMDGFARGVAYYNQKNSKQVQVLGWDVESQTGLFAGNFNNTVDGFRMAESLMDQGADIILPVAGRLGLGTAAAIKERGGAYIIGVDTDWALTYPEYADVVLTSIQKRLDVSVLSAVKAITQGTFTGGAHLGTLENGGVSLAPFHSLDALVLPQIKADLEQIKTDIIAGKIKTGP
jgi:WD40 repeat protein/basic membrane lipoprotein Med (substrate-binding protein (PBP1-ABC) superfamily)/transcriptional regulator with XRE-family HTH domain